MGKIKSDVDIVENVSLKKLLEEAYPSQTNQEILFYSG